MKTSKRSAAKGKASRTVAASKPENKGLPEMNSAVPIHRDKSKAGQLTPRGLARAAKEQEAMAAISGHPVSTRKVS